MKPTLILLSLLFNILAIPEAWSQFNLTESLNPLKNPRFLQLQAMENGIWLFYNSPFYYSQRREYSGAVAPNVYVEAISPVKRITPKRDDELTSQITKRLKASIELDTLKPIYKEEALRFADRNLDSHYMAYKKTFSNLSDLILSNISYITYVSNGKMSSFALDLAKDLESLHEAIGYIHKTGVGYELENEKRRQSYEDLKFDLKELLYKSNQVAFAAYGLYYRPVNNYKFQVE